MQQTTKIYQYINFFFLAISFIYWTTDTSTSQFLFFIGMAGTTALIIINNYYPNTYIWTFLAYFLFTLTILSMLSIWFAIFILIAMMILKPSRAFISGIIYTFWILYAFVLIINLKLFGSSFNYLYTFHEELVIILLIYLSPVLFLGGYIASVIPYYVAKSRSDSERFHTVSLFFIYPVTLICQVFTGVMLGLYFHLKNYISQFRQIVRNQIPIDAENNDQPAIEQYWFYKSYRDWKLLFMMTRLNNKFKREDIKKKTFRLKRIYGTPLSAIPNTVLQIASIMTLILEFTLLIVTSLIHLIIISIVFVPVFIYFIIFRTYDTFYLRKNKVATICPSCYHRSQLPNYTCYQCDREHSDLRPGKFGIRKRKCICGTKLPTTALDKRYDLHALCENEQCHADLFTKEATPITLSVIGGPSSGKTSFLMTAMHDLKEKLIQKQAWTMEFLRDDEEKVFNNQTVALAEGQYPNKTIEQKPFAYNLKLSSEKWKRPKLLYMYDPAGEAYSNSENLRSHHYLDYIDGYVLIIDPFAIPEVSVKYEQDDLQFTNDVNPSATLPEDTYHTLMVHIANQYQVKETEKISVPIAIVINKVDAYQLEHEIAATSLPEDTKADQNDAEKMHEQCKAFLKNTGYRTFVNQIESKFKTYRFFTSSSANLSDTTKKRGSEVIQWFIEQK